MRGCLVLGIAVALLSVEPAASVAVAQGRQADYDRANALRELTRNKVFRDSVRPEWSSDGNRFWYKVAIAPSQFEFVLVDAVAGTREPAFDHQQLAVKLTEEHGETIEAASLPVERLEFRTAPNELVVVTKADRWLVNRPSGEITQLTTADADSSPGNGEARNAEARGAFDGRNRRRDGGGAGNEAGRRSPDGKCIVFVRDHQLWLRPTDNGQSGGNASTAANDGAVPLSLQGTAANGFRDGDLFWSPDSKKLLALRTRAGEKHEVSFVESSPGNQIQPKVHSFDYLKPGDEIPQPVPHLFDIESRREIPLSRELFPNPWMSRPEVHWVDDSSRCFYVYNQRGHQVLRVLSIDASTGEVKVIVDEQSDTFIDYAYKQFLHLSHATNELIWMSERDGWNHLYLYDSTVGAVKNRITTGEWVVRGIDHVDDEKRQIWFRAGSLHEEQDPYYRHHCRVNFDGSNLTALTEGDGDHDVRFSPNRRFLIDTYSRVDQPPVTELRSGEDGSLICELERADWSRLLETGWQVPERFVAKGRDRKTDIFGVIYRPSNFDPQAKYPVIEKIYAGPHGSFVPKEFAAFHSAQEIAELGFIVVQIDGMGTSNRSKAFHDVCWKNLGDSGFPDRILWIKAATQKFPYMDLSNGVGIYGGSAGGQSSTRALLAFGDFYTVAVSDCGCHDNRMDKIWWNELWMGWPIGPHYAEQSNVTQAHRLTGKLLLTVGELDRNVDPASTMQVVDALIKADKDFELLVFPGKGHGIGESPYGKRRRRDFLVRHLLGVEPRRQ
ncbi:prolyl oligopeptidase family serine peptidase [bacterium]|nr:prolyl oligopeptidase family serine peptidase [bacterium]